MTYPVIPNLWRVQVVMQRASALPEDIVTNTLYFEKSAIQTDSEDVDSMVAMLDAFYGTAHGASPSPIATYIANSVIGVTYKVYKIFDPLPRYPVAEVAASWVGGANLGSNALPSEVAICCSFKGGNGPRRRGRIYIGPLGAAQTVTDGVVRPSTTVRQCIADAALDMASSTENTNWVVASPTGADFVPVNSGWVDDAFDTMRSRGEAPTSRIEWSE